MKEVKFNKNKIMNRILSFGIVALVASVPVYLYAQAIPAPDGTFETFLEQLIAIVKIVIQLVMGLALVSFLWGIVSYVISKGAEEKDKARGFIIWGLVGLFVMVSVWGIIGLFTNTFFGGNPTTIPPNLPTIQNAP